MPYAISQQPDNGISQADIWQTEEKTDFVELSKSIARINPSQSQTVNLKNFSHTIVCGHQSFDIEKNIEKIPSLCILSTEALNKQKSTNNNKQQLSVNQLFELERIFQISPRMSINLSSILFQELKNVSYDESPDLIMEFALSRVRNGENCLEVTEDHNIPYDMMDKLQMEAVNGAAGAKVRFGKPCIKVVREHGIAINSKAMKELHMIAVNGPAGERIRAGEHYLDIAHEYGISLLLSYNQEVLRALIAKSVR